MSTEITVVVGADSLLKRDQSTRTARRRDRLDSEALKGQIKVKAQEEDKSKGFNNKKNEYDPSRDPAAHARKKDVPVGGFTTCNIRQLYFKERKRPVIDQFGGVDYNYGGGKFMDIFIKAIKPDGTYGNEIEININRNRFDPMFCVPQSELGVTLSDKYDLFVVQDSQFGAALTWRNPPNWTNYREGVPFSLTHQRGATPDYWNRGWHPYFGPNQSDDIGRPNEFRRLDDGTWDAFGSYEYSYAADIPDQYLSDASGTFDHYHALGGYFDYGGPNYTRYNDNRFMSCGDEDDIQNALGRPGYGDPAYQLFMLPLNKNHSYVVIVYTDIEIAFRGFAHYYGTMSSRVDVDGYHPRSNRYNYFYYKALGGTRRLEPPEYWNPPCFEINSTEPSNQSSTKLTDQAFNKIQQVKIVELKDGVATLIPDDQISVPLRQSLGKIMPLNPETKIPIDLYQTLFMGSGRDFEWFWSYDDSIGPMTYYIKATDDNVVYREDVIDWIAYRQLDFFTKNSKERWGSEYDDAKARQRSLAKGYGFGFLETSNHFDSIYVENGGHPFKAESDYLANDPIFTPAIYTYFGLVAKPSTSYKVVESGLSWSIRPKRFISIDRQTKEVSSVQLPDFLDSISVLYPIDSSLVSKPQEVPIFKRATHYAWNWDNPEFCWERLIDLGFTAAMIGPKPENPKPGKEDQTDE